MRAWAEPNPWQFTNAAPLLHEHGFSHDENSRGRGDQALPIELNSIAKKHRKKLTVFLTAAMVNANPEAALALGCSPILDSLRVAQKSTPSAALLKALIINGAHFLGGQIRAVGRGAAPNNSQGFGRVDVRAVVGPYEPGESLQFFDESKALETGESQDFSVAVPAAAPRLKVTLVWTDPPGEGLQSDLYLVVKIGSVEWHGNMAPDSSEFYRINNVEQVVWTDVPHGTAQISASAHSIALATQGFAIVVRLS